MKLQIRNIFVLLLLIIEVFIVVASATAYEASLDISVSSGIMGNIFYDNEKALLWSDIKNIDTSPVEKTLHFSVINTSHKEIWSNDITITLDAGEETRIEISPKIKKYGVYLLRITDGNNLLCEEHLSRCVKNTTLNKRLGVSTHTTRTGADVNVMELAKNAGFGLARENFRWYRNDTETAADNTQGALGVFLDKCAETGIEPYALMRIECQTPYDNPDGGYSTSDEALEGLEEYYRLTAERLKGRVQYFSAWCELYFIKNPDGTIADGADYVKILKAAYKGLKEGNPDAKLIAFSDLIVKSAVRNTYRQALDVMRAEGEYYFDYFGTHPYHDTKPPEVKEYWDENNSWIDIDGYVKELVSEYNLDDKPRWANEVGYITSRFDDESAAINSIRMLLLNEALNAYEVMNIQCLQDIYSDPKNSAHNYGLVRNWNGDETPFSAKPQYIAYSWWNKLMNGAEFVNMEQTDDKYICYFNKNGKRIIAMWDVSDSRDRMDLPAYGTSVKVYDIYGNMINRAFARDTITLEYSDSPKFIVQEDIDAVVPLSNGFEILKSDLISQ